MFHPRYEYGNCLAIYTGPTIPNYDGTQFFDVFKDLSDDIAVYNDVDAALLGSQS
jgi:hypothetical protein